VTRRRTGTGKTPGQGGGDQYDAAQHWHHCLDSCGADGMLIRIALIILLFLSVSVSQAVAQTCGPDPAPPQAAAQGYTCQTFRWGSGDTASEIDSAQTYAPGFKWYWGTASKNGHATVASDYSVQPGGKIVTQTSIPADHGAIVLGTCGGPASSSVWTTGQFFQHGWYVEFVGEWNSTGHSSVQTGFYGIDLNWYTIPPTTWPASCPPGACWEVDDPDAMAFDQAVAAWAGGTAGLQPNTGHTFSAPNVETGTNRYGAMSTSSAVTWWINDTANGSAVITAAQALDVYNSKQCWGTDSTAEFPLTIDSVKVWQAPPPPPPGGGVGGCPR
jgi:hypothetical protein